MFQVHTVAGRCELRVVSLSLADANRAEYLTVECASPHLSNDTDGSGTCFAERCLFRSQYAFPVELVPLSIQMKNFVQR